MISIKHYLNRAESEAVLWQGICLLLEKIGDEAVYGDRLEYDAFVRNIEKIRESVASTATPETLLVTIGAAVQAMAGHKQQVAKFMQRQRGEIRTFVSMLTETVVKMTGENTHFAGSFQEIGERMENAGVLDDLQELKLRLHECLLDFRNETLQQKAEMEDVILALQQQLQRTREAAGPLDESKFALDLPQPGEAEAAMLDRIQAGTRNYVATVVIRRMQSINERFGYHVGDRVLQTCRVKVGQQLLPGDQMFRWSGPVLVMLLERADLLEAVRGQLKRILDAKIEETYDLGNRAVMIPISTAWNVFKLTAPVNCAIKQIQTFVASQIPRDSV
jgi:GGDEF domain-containing protein